MATIGDTFVEATNTLLQDHTATGPNGGHSWTKTFGSAGQNITVLEASDTAVGTSSVNNLRYRAESDLASDDHSAEVTVVTWAGTTNTVGIIVRFDPAADSGYLFLVRNTTTSTYRLFKVTNGTLAQIASVDAAAPGNGVVLRLDVNGDQLEGFANNVSVVGPTTDTTFSGQLRTGLLVSHTNTIDDFEGGDLGAASFTGTASPTQADDTPTASGTFTGFPTASLANRYEAKDHTGLVDGDPVAVVTDQSGNGWHLNIGGTQPTWETNELNGHAVYRFDGVDDFRRRDETFIASGLTEVSIAVVCRATAEGTSRTWPFGLEGAAFDWIFAFTEGETASEWGTFVRTTEAGDIQLATSGVDTTQDAFLLIVWDGADVVFYHNGVQVATAAKGGTLDYDDIYMGEITAGNFGGDVALAASWHKALDSTERANLDDYIATTYGIGFDPANLAAVQTGADVDLTWDASF